MIQVFFSVLIVIVLGIIITFYIQLQYQQFHSRQLLSYCPNVWTSLGILGTFFSIVLSLTIDSNYSDVSKLIRNLSPAFWTSIIGILGAIFCSIKIKEIYAKEDANDEKAYKAQTNKTPEVVLANLLKVSEESQGLLNQIVNSITTNYRDLLIKQDKAINVMSSQSSIIEGFVNKLIDQLDTYYKNVLNNTNESTRKLIEDHFVNYANILNRYNEMLVKNSSEEIKNHNQILKDVHNQIVNDVKGQFDIIHSVYKAEFDNFSRTNIVKIDNIIRKLTEFIESYKQKAEVVESLVTRHTLEINSKVSEESQSLDRIHESLVNTSSSVTKSLGEMLNSVVDIQKEIITNIHNITNSTTNGIQQLSTQTINQLSNINDNIVKNSKVRIEKEFDSMLALVREDSKKVLKEVEDFRNGLANKEEERAAGIYQSLDEKISYYINNLTVALDKDTKQIEEFLNKMQTTSNERQEVLNTLKILIQELKEEQKLVMESMNTTKDNIETANHIHDELKQKGEAILGILNKTGDDIYKLVYDVSLLRNPNPVEVLEGHKICPDCNEKNPEDAHYCSHCGTPI